MLYKKLPLIIQTAILLCLTYGCQEQNKSNSDTAEDPHAHHAHSTTENKAYADSVNNGLITQDTLKGSPNRVAMANVGSTHVHISYRSPGVRNRVIWGGLVPFGQVWATGAHTATSIMFSNDITIDGQVIPAGMYAIFTIPDQEEWTFILNKNHQQHLADDYSQDEDVLRVKFRPDSHEMTPRLTYEIKPVNESQGIISIRWEKIEMNIPFTIS